MLSLSRHTNKLRVGHLKGNRFTIRLAGAGAENLVHAREGLEILRRRGVPNAYMGQRFGLRSNTHLMGRALLRGGSGAFLDMLLEFGEEDGPWAHRASAGTCRA